MLEKWRNGHKIKVQELGKTVKESKRNSPKCERRIRDVNIKQVHKLRYLGNVIMKDVTQKPEGVLEKVPSQN